jgi:lipopolysaccharide/colanic/teichoic acid biosynthesis glycosyltransferase
VRFVSPPEFCIESPLDSKISHGAVRRGFDILAASLALVMFAPVMVTIAAAVIIESGLPIMFRQPRIGVGGRPFQMYKFRKFYQTCEGPALTTTDDIRFTRVGRFLGKTKLDELPQLWNVVRGDMAIVGPRPESFDFSTCYRGGFEEALRYKPGLVGPSQVFFRHEASQYPADEDPARFYREMIFPIKAGVDIAYFRRRTLMSDFVWIWRSALAIFGWIRWEPNLRAI